MVTCGKSYRVMTDRDLRYVVTGTGRFDELDAARGIAILMMVLFHTLFDLAYFHIFPVNVGSGFWRYFAFATGSLFLLIAGISLSVSHARFLCALSKESRFPAQVWIKYLRRGGGIFACGLLITLATWIVVPQSFIVFGILHLIGFSIIIAPLFFRFRDRNILIGAIMVAMGAIIWVSGITGPYGLLWLGIHPVGFSTLDYYPVLPWTGVVLIGLGLGERMYPNGERGFSIPRMPAFFTIPLTFLGRHSLVIYLVHQPVILLLLALITGTTLFW